MNSIRVLLLGLMFCPAVLHADDLAYRQAMAKAVRAAAGQVLPSVVTIEIIGTDGAGQGEVEQDAPTSGVVVDSDGYVLASSLVVRRPSASILVVLPDGTRHAATVVSQDHHRDLVLLKIKTDQPLTAIELPDEDRLPIGATTVGVGRYGGAPMVSRGVLSARERLDGIALQTDARVSPALYGGPLVDLYGNVLGILIPAVAQGGAEDATSWYDSGIAFAIPANVIARKLGRLKAGQNVNKGLIGIVSRTKDPYQEGTEIAAVRTRSPAEAAGIQSGDKVRRVAGRPVRRHQEIRQALGSFDAGEEITLVLDRDGREIELQVTLAETIPPLQPQRLGVIAADRTIAATEEETAATDEAAAESEATTEVTVESIVPGSGADGRLNPGDVLLSINDASIADAASLRRQLITAEPDVEITIAYRRDGQQAETNVMPASIAGVLDAETPPTWEPEGETWSVEEIQLPDAGNAAAYTSVPQDTPATRLGLLIHLLNPGQGEPAKVLEDWLESAEKTGVVVCAIAPENNRRWQPKELEVVAKFATSVMKKAPIEDTAVAVAAAGALSGNSAEAADSMALLVAMSQSSTFFGVAVSAKTRPPAVRLRENEPASSLQILFPVASEDDLPSWHATIQRAGYPVIRADSVDQSVLLRWTRLLQAI